VLATSLVIATCHVPSMVVPAASLLIATFDVAIMVVPAVSSPHDWTLLY
jgi:hypothetical protein